jgi:tetratricopeptide (TPR) repeat protein
MPQTVNGCGTWYYGKKNLQQYQGVCRSCHALTTLSSYDTRLYVVVAFIPIIPLARKRIIEQCPACTRHGAMPLDDWHRAEKRSADAIAAYRARPQDRELAKEAMAACAGFRNLPQFLDVAPDVERNLPRDGETLRLLAAVYDLFGRAADVERVLKLALAAQDEDETRELLADCLLRQNRPHEAQALLAHVVERGIPDRVGALYSLAQGYQLKGDHEKAVEVFRQCEMVNPHITQDETFVRLRDESARRLGTKEPVQPMKVVNRAKREASFRKFKRVGPVVVALALIAYGIVCFLQGRRRQVYLVNALHKPYTVRLNGQPYRLDPRAATPVRVQEGALKVELDGLSEPVPAETADVRTQFFTRPFSGAVFVINPDHAAVVRKTRMFYHSERSGSAGRRPETEYHAGRLLHRFDGIDYPFEAFPTTLKLESSSSDVEKVGLLLPEEEPATIAAALVDMAEQLGRPAVTEVVKRHMLLEPERSEYLPALAMLTEPAERVEFLRPGLERRPVVVNWHRAYQDALTSSGQDDRAEREYVEMLTREPDNPDLLYLAGRAAIDMDKALDLLRRATEGSPPSAHAFFALSGYYLANGDFDLASRHAETVLRMMPGEQGVRWYCRQALLAGGKYDRVLKMLHEDQSGPAALAVGAVSEEVGLRAMLAKQNPALAAEHASNAQYAVTSVCDRLAAEYEPEAVAPHTRRFEAQKAYCSGDAAGFVKILTESSDPHDHFAAYVTSGNIEAAEAALEPGADADRHLLLYLAASQAGNRAVADKHLRAATGLLAKGDYESRAFGKALAAETTVPLAQMLRFRMTPRQKVVLLAALGVKDAAARDACFALGRLLNYDPRFPHLLLDQVFAGAPSDGPSR